MIGAYATAANFCLASVEVGGLRFYTRRKVYPRLGPGAVVRFPTLVGIEIDDVQVLGKARRPERSRVSAGEFFVFGRVDSGSPFP